MRRISSKLFFTILFFVPLLSGCILNPSVGIRGSGNIEEEIRQVNNFDEIELHTIADVDIHFSESTLISVEAEENLLRYIQTDVTGTKLVIDLPEGISLLPQERILINVWTPALKSVKTSSTGDITIDDFSTVNFTAEVSSTGDIDIENLQANTAHLKTSSTGDITVSSLVTEQLEAEISSTGDITIRDGEVEYQSISISSTGDYQAMNVTSKIAEISLSSTGDASLSVSDSLGASMSGTGNLRYVGNPELDIENSGVGDVRQLDQ